MSIRKSFIRVETEESHPSIQDTTVGKVYTGLQMEVGEVVYDRGCPLCKVLSPSFLFVDDVGDSAESFLSAGAFEEVELALTPVTITVLDNTSNHALGGCTVGATYTGHALEEGTLFLSAERHRILEITHPGAVFLDDDGVEVTYGTHWGGAVIQEVSHD